MLSSQCDVHFLPLEGLLESWTIQPSPNLHNLHNLHRGLKISKMSEIVHWVESYPKVETVWGLELLTTSGVMALTFHMCRVIQVLKVMPAIYHLPVFLFCTPSFPLYLTENIWDEIQAKPPKNTWHQRDAMLKQRWRYQQVPLRVVSHLCLKNRWPLIEVCV